MKAVIYCRVSTEEESQANALADQVQEAKNCAQSKDWELIDSYIDEGKSGTTVKKRNEYNRLFEDLLSDKFDIIVIKSQDRLMRNTKDWYLFIDALVSNGKKLFFYLEDKFYTPDDALITGIKAILAEEYSRELSKKIRNAHKNRQEKGQSILINSRTWGYDKVNKEVVINEKEAEVVRTIFDLCIQGYGSRSVSKTLSNMGIKSRTGKDFPEITVRRIIRNPLFMGTAVMNKRTTDFNTKKITNNSPEEWKLHKQAVPAIVSEEVWEKANQAMDARAKEEKVDDFKTKTIGKNIGKYELSSKIVCGICGSVYWRRYRRRYSNKEEIVVDWSCSEYIKRGRLKNGVYKNEKDIKVVTPDQGCDNAHIKEENLMNLLSEVADGILINKKDSIMERAMDILGVVFNQSDIDEERKKVDAECEKYIYQKDLLMDKLLDGTISDADYKRRIADIDKILADLLEEKNLLKEREEQIKESNDRLTEIAGFLSDMSVGEARLANLIKHIKEIKVFPDRLEVQLDFYDKIVTPLPKKNKKQYQYVDVNKNLTTVNY